MRIHSTSLLVLSLAAACSSLAHGESLRSFLSFDVLKSTTTTTAAPAKAIDDMSCKYNLFKLSCEPADACSLQYEFGDVTPSQACRVNKAAVGTSPQQVHLAFAGATPGTAMTISWTTYSEVKDPAVWVGASAAALELSPATVSVATYYKDDEYSLFNYHATVTGLMPSTSYSFQVGSKASVKDRNQVGAFTTGRAVTDQREFDIAIFGDMGVDANALKTVEYVNAKLPGKVDFVFHLGDISYADNAGLLTATEVVGFFYEETFNKYMSLMSPIMEQTPYMVLVGNHEAECHAAACQLSSDKKDQLGNYTAYNTRFKMPSAESGGVKNMWYSFDHGPIHFTTISSETDYTDAPSNSYTGRKYGGFGNQMAWLEADLKKADANRGNTPWLIVMMHRAIYTRTKCDENGVPTGEAAPVQKAFEDLFIKYNVDVVVSGHVHLYSRNLPTKKNLPVMDGVSEDKKTYASPKAPVYIISGAAGSNEGHKPYDTKQNAPWNAVMDNKNWGITKLHVSRSSLRWQFVSVETDTVLDDFTITK